MTGPRNDPEAEWASVVPSGEFPDDLHGNTRGKRYQFNGRCPECLVEAAERQQAGGLGAGFPRRVLTRSLVFLGPPNIELTRTVDRTCHHLWSVALRIRGE